MLTQEYLEWIKSLLGDVKQPTSLYVIEKYNDKNDKFFFYDLVFLDDDSKDRERKQVVWTPQFRQAYLFYSEMEVEEFKSAYITPRKSSIARIPMVDMAELIRRALRKV